MISVDLNPDKRKLRTFAMLLIAVLAGLSYVYFRSASWFDPLILFWVCFAIGLSGLLYQKPLKYIYVGLVCLTFPIGFIVSHVLLMLVFYLMFLPIGVCLRLFGHDPLNLRKPASTPSYWIKSRLQKPPKSYYNPY
jgi:hypothetical protein